MKRLAILFLLIIINDRVTFSQCQYGDKSNSPEELFRKRLRPEGMRYGNPYTMFVKGDDFNLNNSLEAIRENIKKGNAKNSETDFQNDYGNLYYQIYTSVTGNNSSEPDRCQKLMEEQNCAHPAWVKNNAIIYLVGLKYEVINGVGKFVDFPNPTEREAFATKAYEGLQKLNPEVNSCTFGGDFDRHWYTLGAQERCGKIRVKAAELMRYLQAYDLLKAGGKILFLG